MFSFRCLLYNAVSVVYNCRNSETELWWDNGTELSLAVVKGHSHAREHLFPAYSSSILFWNKPILSSVSNTERNAIPKSSVVNRPSKSSCSKTAHVESSSSKRRRSRTVFSDAQLLYLEERYVEKTAGWVLRFNYLSMIDATND